MMARSTAICCSAKRCVTRRPSAASQPRLRDAGSPFSPISSAAPRPRASLRSRIPGRSPARTTVAKSGERRAAVGVVTTTGGGATTAIDPLAARGVAIEPPSAATLARLTATTGIEVKPARLVDLTLAGTRYDAMKAALDVLTSAPEFDLMLCVVGSSARFYPELAVRPIIDSAGSGKPIAAYLTPGARRS